MEESPAWPSTPSIAIPVNRKGDTLPERLEKKTGKPWVRKIEGEYYRTALTASDKVKVMMERYFKLHQKGANYLAGQIPD